MWSNRLRWQLLAPGGAGSSASRARTAVDDGQYARRDLPCGGKGCRRRQTAVRRFLRRLGRMGRLRGVVIPARGRPRLALDVAVLLNLEPDTSTGTEASTRTATACGSSSGPRRGRAAGSASGDRVLRRRSSARRTVDPGRHNRENAAAAAAAARAAASTPEGVARGAQHVPPRAPPGPVGEAGGVRFVKTRRRRTSPPLCGPSRRTPKSPSI